MSTISYLKNLIKDPDVASVTPSSRFLVQRMCKHIDFDQPAIIVEYGPGTGVFSAHILDRMHDDARLILIESNAAFVDELQQTLGRDARVTIHHDVAQHVQAILEAAGPSRADYVLSGIPFSFLNDKETNELLEQTYNILTEDGAFLVYQHYNHLEQPLRECFDRVDMERELLNIPPVCTYKATKHA